VAVGGSGGGGEGGRIYRNNNIWNRTEVRSGHSLVSSHLIIILGPLGSPKFVAVVPPANTNYPINSGYSSAPHFYPSVATP